MGSVAAIDTFDGIKDSDHTSEKTITPTKGEIPEYIVARAESDRCSKNHSHQVPDPAPPRGKTILCFERYHDSEALSNLCISSSILYLLSRF